MGLEKRTRTGSSILNSQTTLYGSCLLCLSAAISVCFFFWKMMCIVTLHCLGNVVSLFSANWYVLLKTWFSGVLHIFIDGLKGS